MAGELTGFQKTNIRWAYENAQLLADPEGRWQEDLAAVVETGETISNQLKAAFSWLGDEEDE